MKKLLLIAAFLLAVPFPAYSEDWESWECSPQVRAMLVSCKEELKPLIWHHDKYDRFPRWWKRQTEEKRAYLEKTAFRCLEYEMGFYPVAIERYPELVYAHRHKHNSETGEREPPDNLFETTKSLQNIIACKQELDPVDYPVSRYSMYFPVGGSGCGENMKNAWLVCDQRLREFNRHIENGTFAKWWRRQSQEKRARLNETALKCDSIRGKLSFAWFNGYPWSTCQGYLLDPPE